MNLRSATAGLGLHLALLVFLAVTILSYLRGVEPLTIVLRGIGAFLVIVFFQRIVSSFLEAWLGGEAAAPAPAKPPKAKKEKQTAG
jgi:hypothetical protein